MIVFRTSNKIASIKQTEESLPRIKDSKKKKKSLKSAVNTIRQIKKVDKAWINRLQKTVKQVNFQPYLHFY